MLEPPVFGKWTYATCQSPVGGLAEGGARLEELVAPSLHRDHPRGDLALLQSVPRDLSLYLLWQLLMGLHAPHAMHVRQILPCRLLQSGS